MLILRHSHVTAIFVNNDIQRRRQDQKFASVKRLAGCLQNFMTKDGRNVSSTGCFRSSEKLRDFEEFGRQRSRHLAAIWRFLASRGAYTRLFWLLAGEVTVKTLVCEEKNQQQTWETSSATAKNASNEQHSSDKSDREHVVVWYISASDPSWLCAQQKIKECQSCALFPGLFCESEACLLGSQSDHQQDRCFLPFEHCVACHCRHICQQYQFLWASETTCWCYVSSILCQEILQATC